MLLETTNAQVSCRKDSKDLCMYEAFRPGCFSSGGGCTGRFGIAGVGWLTQVREDGET
jgi:hypothetical protein